MQQKENALNVALQPMEKQWLEVLPGFFVQIVGQF